MLLPRLRDAGYDRVLIAATFRQALADVRREEHAGQSSVRNATAPLSRGLVRAIMLVHEQCVLLVPPSQQSGYCVGFFVATRRGDEVVRVRYGVTRIR